MTKSICSWEQIMDAMLDLPVTPSKYCISKLRPSLYLPAMRQGARKSQVPSMPRRYPVSNTRVPYMNFKLNKMFHIKLSIPFFC